MIIKNPYTLLNGELVHINDKRIKSGLNKDYKCPDNNCNAPLIARKGEKKAYHFSHKPGDKCFGLESALHLKSKEIIENLDELYLPSYRIWPHSVLDLFEKDIFEIEKNFTYPLNSFDFFKNLWWPPFFEDDEFNLFSNLSLDLSNYEIESEVLLEGHKPDVRLTNKKTGEVVYIEIAVTSFISDEKKSLIKDQNLSVIEIDLSKYYKSEYYSPDKTKELEEYLKVIFKNDWTYKTKGWRKYSDARFNWINLKNKSQLILNRKNRFVKTFQKKLSGIYEFYNNEFIHILDNHRNVLKFTKDRELEAELRNSEYKDITNKLTGGLIGHFKKMYLQSELYKEQNQKHKSENANRESLEDFRKRMTNDDDIIFKF